MRKVISYCPYLADKTNLFWSILLLLLFLIIIINIFCLRSRFNFYPSFVYKYYFKRFTFIERKVSCVLLFAKYFSLCNILKYLAKEKKKQRDIVDIYVIIRTIILLIILFCCQPYYPNPVLLIITYFLIEMLAATLQVQFVNYYVKAERPSSPNRSIILLFIGYFEVIIIYAIYYLSSLNIVNNDGERLKSACDSLYFSVVTITTLGYGDWKPLCFYSKFLVVSEVLIGILLIVLMLSSFVNMLGKTAKH